jgi:pantoate--beta-alanine ligase
MSSRNRYLSLTERQQAAQLFQTLKLAETLATESTMTPPEIAQQMTDHLNSAEGIEVQYAVIADSGTLESLTERSDSAVALLAARVGSTRLIDNQILRFR